MFIPRPPNFHQTSVQFPPSMMQSSSHMSIPRSQQQPHFSGANSNHHQAPMQNQTPLLPLPWQTPPSNNPTAMGASSSNTCSRLVPRQWTHDVTADANNLTQLTDPNGIDNICMDNGFGLKVHSVGSTCFNSPFDNSVNLTLNNLLHVPTLTQVTLPMSWYMWIT